MLNYFFLLLFCYFAIRFIIGFVIPVVTAALRMKRKMKEMSDFEPGSSKGTTNGYSGTVNPGKSAPVRKDYIDFEEVKD